MDSLSFAARSPMAIKFVLSLFFLIVEGEQFGSLKYSYWFLVLCSKLLKYPATPSNSCGQNSVNQHCIPYFSSTAQSQECVQNLPLFADQSSSNIVERLMSGTQAIIPDYSFDCYGNVTQWGAFVERHGGDVRYNLDFQVWRRSGGGQGTTGEYDFVGNNYFPSIDPPRGGRIDRIVPVEQQIKVRPGDVIGLYITTSSDNGVELKQQDTSNGETLIMWFGTNLTAALSTRIGVGSTSGYELMSTTTAVPVITVVVVPSVPSPSQTPSLSPTPPPSSPGLPTLNTVLATTSLPSLFLPSPVTTSSPVGSGLLVLGAIVAVIIVVLIVVVLGVLVFLLALALRRRSKKSPDNHSVLGNRETPVLFKLQSFQYFQLYSTKSTDTIFYI